MSETAHRPKAEDLVNGNWEEILQKAGMASDFFTYIEGPCPICGGRTRFRWRVKTEDGFCNGCRHLSPWTILKHFLSTDDFTVCADFVRDWAGYGDRDRPGSVPARPISPPKPAPDPAEELRETERVRAWYKSLWDEGHAVVEGDPVWNYLKGRFPTLKSVPKAIRYHPNLVYKYSASKDEPKKIIGYFPALLAAAQGVDGRVANIWRQYIDPVTFDKADVPGPKKMAAGRFLQPSYAVRLFEPDPNSDTLAVSEGIESAIGVSLVYGIPCWSCLMADGIGKFRVPKGYEHIRKFRIFADNDEPDQFGRRAGNDNAEKLKEFLRSEGHIATIIKPKFTSFDFANIAERKI